MVPVFRLLGCFSTNYAGPRVCECSANEMHLEKNRSSIKERKKKRENPKYKY